MDMSELRNNLPKTIKIDIDLFFELHTYFCNGYENDEDLTNATKMLSTALNDKQEAQKA